MTQGAALKRGFVEALFILSSILLAFWVDAWWDDRQAEQLEAEIRLAVQAEAEQNLREIDRVRGQLTERIDGADRFLRSTAAELSSLEAGRLSAWINQLTVPVTFLPEREASSVLATIPMSRSNQSGEARRLVSKWLSRLETAEVRRGRVSDLTVVLKEHLSYYAVRSASEGYAGISAMAARGNPGLMAELRGDRDFVALVIRMADARRVYSTGLTGVETTLDSLSVVLRVR